MVPKSLNLARSFCARLCINMLQVAIASPDSSPVQSVIIGNEHAKWEERMPQVESVQFRACPTKKQG